MNARRMAELDDRPADASDAELAVALTAVFCVVALGTWLLATYGGILVEWLR